VIFVCHAPGFEAVVDQFDADRVEHDRPQTFPSLLLDALSRNIPLDRSVYYARTQVMRRASWELGDLFGAPGYYGALGLERGSEAPVIPESESLASPGGAGRPGRRPGAPPLVSSR
jgi:hypothetical protein